MVIGSLHLGVKKCLAGDDAIVDDHLGVGWSSGGGRFISSRARAWLVMTQPSTTTLASVQPAITSLNLGAGKLVALSPSSPCLAKTTAGLAHTAAVTLPAPLCFLSISTSGAQSLRCSAPGMPPGQAMASHSCARVRETQRKEPWARTPHLQEPLTPKPPTAL